MTGTRIRGYLDVPLDPRTSEKKSGFGVDQGLVRSEEKPRTLGSQAQGPILRAKTGLRNEEAVWKVMRRLASESPGC